MALGQRLRSERGFMAAMEGLRPMSIEILVTEREREMLKRAAAGAGVPVKVWAMWSLLQVAEIEGYRVNPDEEDQP